ncbi:MAG: hypothetical protein ABII74_10355 [Elusimicrobiota bacterium]
MLVKKISITLISLTSFVNFLGAADWHWSGVLAGDYRTISQKPEEREIENNAQLSDFFLKMEGTLAEKVPFLAEFKINDDGGFRLIRAETVYQPYSFLELKIGQLLLPFGLWNENFEPDDYLTLTKPLLYAGPGLDYIARNNFPHPFFSAGFADVGVLGKFSPVVAQGKIDCAIYLVNGFKEDGRLQPRPEAVKPPEVVGEDGWAGKEVIDIDWTAEERFIWDNNDTKMAGGRILWQSTPDLSLGSSGLIGKYDLDDELDHWTAGADLSWRWNCYWKEGEKNNLRAEYVLGSTDFRSTFPKSNLHQVRQRYSTYGYYWQLDFPALNIHPIDKTRMVLGYDILYRVGPELDKDGFFIRNDGMDIKTKIEKYTTAINLDVNRVFSIKAEIAYWNFDVYNDIYEMGLGGVVKF